MRASANGNVASDHPSIFAIMMIIINECAERFTYYGVAPLLKNFFMHALGMSKIDADSYTHIFKSLSYFFPLVGAAVADSFLNKFWTIGSFSILYLIGTIMLAVTSIPHLLSSTVAIPSWGPLLGLLLLAIGTGGIKPCVSALGGDQFLNTKGRGLQSFYNYFYIAINVGSLASGFITPALQQRSCYGGINDCFPLAFGVCAAMMGFALIVFLAGYRSYIITPAPGTFLPAKLAYIGGSYVISLFANGFKSVHAEAHTVQLYGAEIVREMFDLAKVILMILPAPLFWTAFDQNGSTFQDITDRMDSTNWMSSEMLNAVTNPILIVILTPIFTEFLYPFMDRHFPNRFRLLDRMVVGMFLSAVSFFICAGFLYHIDSVCTERVVSAAGVTPVVSLCIADGFHAAWFTVPYIVITAGEVFFSISGLNFTYTEVGQRTKSSCAALWLLTVAIGNALAAVILDATRSWDQKYFFILIGGLCFLCGVFQFGLSYNYVYRADREDEDGGEKGEPKEKGLEEKDFDAARDSVLTQIVDMEKA